jgi:hypothetical protein
MWWMPSEYYVWSVSRKSVEVRLNLTVVDRIQALASWAFHNAGKEIHGILLGRIERRGQKRRVYVEELDLFDPATGPPRSRHRPWFDCVGLFRSNIRESLRLDHVDATLISDYFTNPAMVYLLVQPANGGASTGAFFIQEDGRVRGYGSYLQFPFHAEALRTGGFRVIAEAEQPASGGRWRWIAGLAAVLVALIAGWWFWPRARIAAAAPSASTSAPKVTVSEPASPAPAANASPASAMPDTAPMIPPAPVQTAPPPVDATGEAGEVDRATPPEKPQRKPKRSGRRRGRAAIGNAVANQRNAVASVWQRDASVLAARLPEMGNGSASSTA